MSEDKEHDDIPYGWDEKGQAVPEPTQAVALREPNAKEAIAALDKPNAPITAAQAKIDAVAAVTATAYARASYLRLTAEEIAGLQAEFPDEAFKKGAAGKDNLIYIEHAFLRDRLNQVIGPGQWALIPRNRWAEDFTMPTRNGPIPCSRVYVEAMLMVRGCYVSEDVGDMVYFKNNETQNYGDAVEGAKTAALRRCCKEFGIGLQAWKKDWCDGWWQRNPLGKVMAKRQDAPRSAPPPPPSPTPTQPPPKPPGATQAHKERLLVLLDNDDGLACAKEFFEKINALLPTEALEDLGLEYVPVTKEQADALLRCIHAFAQGDEARLPYPKNPASFEEKPAAKPKAPPPGQEMDEDAAKRQPWYGQIVPVPRRGMKRDEYLKNPDTIGSLYESRHGTDDLDQEARQRLFGFVNNFEPKPWVGRDGQERPPSAADRAFRAALDSFADWFEKTHPDEKL